MMNVIELQARNCSETTEEEYSLHYERSKQREGKDRKLTDFSLWEFGQDGRVEDQVLEIFTRRNLSRLSVSANS